MSDVVLHVDRLSKKFRKGQLHDSLRDFLPALVKRMKRPRSADTLLEREFWALRDVSFVAHGGEALGIIGRNGAGKSTMLKLLAGIMKPTSGTLTVRGRLSAMIEIGAGFHPDLTGRENIHLNGTILGMRREEIRRKFDAIVDFSGLEEFIDTPVKRYSSGMFARLGFSVAAHLDPDILVIDEVLSVGDYLFQRKGLDKMLAVARGGATVIFVSHNLQSVADLCPRCLLLDRGRVIASGPTTDVVGSYLKGAATVETGAAADQPAYIGRSIIRSKAGESVRFASGEKVRVDVEVVARARVERLSLVVLVRDQNGNELFTASTERLGAPPFTLGPGEKIVWGFELVLHLAPGTYYVRTALYRYDVQRDYGRFPVGTIFIHSETDIGGVVNLYPCLVPYGAPFG